MSAAPAWPGTQALLPSLLEWAGGRRWFPLKSGPVPSPERVEVVVDAEFAPGIHDLLLALPKPSAEGEGTAGSGRLLLHVPLVIDEVSRLASLTRSGEREGAAGFTLTTPEGRKIAVVDGPHHPDFWRTWAGQALQAGSVLDEQAARAIMERADRLKVTTGEQSNTSVILRAPRSGEEAGAADTATTDLIVKVFRVLEAGRNPDVEVSVALAKDGWDRVRHPVAWSTLSFTDVASGLTVEADSAVGTTFIPAATDGFELFCDLAGRDDVDGPVRAQALDLATDLGVTTAQMHEHLARSLGQHEPTSPAALRGELAARASWALGEVPELSRAIPGLASGVDNALDRLAALDQLDPATRVHGDYHLGQTLHEDGGAGRWFVLDFEGEPLRPLSQRCEPDQSARDVAGMLRSFDYAAAVGGAADPGWLPAVREAFIAGYRAQRPLGSEVERERAEALLTALELDKALYEAVYEARNRPAWLHIPQSALSHLTDKIISTKSPIQRG